MYPALVKAIVEHMNLSNREELSKILDQAAQPDPQQQQMQQEAHQKQMALQDAQIQAVSGQGAESYARAEKYKVEAALEPQKLEVSRLDAVADIRQGVETKDFERRLKIAETKLKEKELNIKEADMRLRNRPQTKSEG